MSANKTIFITGGAGFIGSHVIRRFINKYPDYSLVNIDSLTYAGNLENLRDVEGNSNYTFEKVDIVNAVQVQTVFEKYQPDAIIHLAAESHVDRSIKNPLAFVETNVIGTVNLLNAAKVQMESKPDFMFYHVSTDEVYGALGDTGLFHETTAYDPRSPYSASKASSDHFVSAYHHTYGLKMVMSNCSNNYGPFQFPEKLIPLIINNIIEEKDLPVYGKGENVRDWLWVEDHAAAIDLVFHEGRLGETYNIGGDNEIKNIDVVRNLCAVVDRKLGRPKGTSEKKIKFVTDRAGHDFRYAIDFSKINSELGWKPSLTYQEGLEKTVDWYLSNEKWIAGVTSGEYQNYYKDHYRE